jgi:hypothetical protein
LACGLEHQVTVLGKTHNRRVSLLPRGSQDVFAFFVIPIKTLSYSRLDSGREFAKLPFLDLEI